MYERSHCDHNTLLALCISAIILFFPANLLPIVQIDIVGNLRDTTVVGGAIAVIEHGFGLVGVAVLVTGVIAPLVLLCSILTQLLLLKTGNNNRLLRWLLLRHTALKQLSMIEIYLISYLISVFKLADFSTLTFGWGAGCYLLLFVLNFYVLYEYNPKLMWQQYESKQR